MKHNHPVILAYEARKNPVPPVQSNAVPLRIAVNPAMHPVPPVQSNPMPVHIDVLDIGKPSWIEDPGVIEALRESDISSVYYSCQGYSVDKNTGLVSDVGSYREGIISALAVNYDTDNEKVNTAPALIVNTENAGLRYVHCGEDGSMRDIGPVINACFIGNVERPEGLYIPLTNTKAMADGLDTLEHIMHKRIETGVGMKESDPCFACKMDCSSCFHADLNSGAHDF